MGVNSCDRKNCTHVMCNRFSNKYGYICAACFDELVSSRLTIEDFMKTDIGEPIHDRYKEIDKEFKFT